MSAAEKDMGELVAACDRTRDEFASHLETIEAQGLWLDRGYRFVQSVRPWLKWLAPIGSTLLFRKRKEAISGLGRLASVLKRGLQIAPPLWSWWRKGRS